MARWLVKEEPDGYSFADLERDGSVVWDGVGNPLARKHLAAIRPGDAVWYYHTGKEKAVVGVAEAAAPGPDDPPAAVRLRPVRRLARPVTLARIKADPELADWELVRLPRLSVMPVTDAQWARVEQLSQDG
jgi:predicted RNA-binding protein with PUA-like domain